MLAVGTTSLGKARFDGHVPNFYDHAAAIEEGQRGTAPEQSTAWRFSSKETPQYQRGLIVRCTHL
jgi:hypothetical protein